jgi:hypothetical protein
LEGKVGSRRSFIAAGSRLLYQKYLYQLVGLKHQIMHGRGIVSCRRKSTMMLGYPLKPEKEFWSASPAGDLRKKESHLIQKSMEQSGYIYSNHCIETYEEIKERFHYVTYQTGDPDVVRV